MLNESIFLLHSIVIAGTMLCLLPFGRSGLTAGVCLYSILSNLFVTKQITLFGFETISTDVFTIGAVFGLNLLQEHFGLDATRKAINCNFVLMTCYLIMSQLHLAYAPNSYDTMHPLFQQILDPMLRITVVSVASYFISQYCDAYLYRALKNRFHDKHLVMRNFMSLSCSQLLDTVLFSVAALYGTVHNVLHVIIISYAIKMLVVLINSPFIVLSKKLTAYFDYE